MPHLLKTQAYLNGCWITATETFPVCNPATGERIADVPQLGAAETTQAVEAAHKAFGLWRKRSAHERAALLHSWHDLILAHTDELAEILTRENGKPLAEARAEVQYAASYLAWFSEEAKRVYGDLIPAAEADKRIFALKQPVGVVGIITPWNFPIAMLARKVSAALAAGCTVVIKPSDFTPLSALAICVLAEEAGFPAGVINLITSQRAAEVGEVLTQHPLVRKISFTGSTEVGRLLMRQCAEGIKRMSMELGGNAPFIVFEDADVDAAVQGAIAAKYRNAGQTCVCANRIYVQAAVYDEFVEKFKRASFALKVGNGLEAGTQIGPLINEKALQKVEMLLAEAQGRGAKIHQAAGKLEGLFFQPTVVTGANSEMLLHQTEIFGPVAAVYRFETEEEAIILANQTEYGLAAYFYGTQFQRIWRVAEALDYGMLGINTGLISTAVAPFGGIKQSGFGREGSKYGLDDYLDIKYLNVGGMA